jgi:hypothetical protein
MVFVAFPPIVRSEKNLDVMPRALSGVGVGLGARINEVDIVTSVSTHHLPHCTQIVHITALPASAPRRKNT